MRTNITAAVVVASIITTCAAPAFADDPIEVGGDEAVSPDAAAEESTWGNRALTFGGLGAGYAALYGWTFMAWHYRAEEADHIQFYDDGWFASDSYAGGADKMGHAWMNYMLTRGGTRLLQKSGWSQGYALAASGGLAFGFFTLSEIKDGYNPAYGFSTNDIIANLSGQALGVAMELSPWLDERIDFRVEYLPSKAFLDEASEEGIFNTAEDYTGQTYYLAYHLGSIDTLRNDPRTSWTRYVDLSVGFHTEAFLPHEKGSPPRQDLFVGVSMNLQELFDPGFMHFATEVYSVPYTTIPLVKTSRVQAEPPSVASMR